LNIKTYIPLASHGDKRQYLCGQAREALLAQTVKITPDNIVECLTDGEIHSQRNYSAKRTAQDGTGEAGSRNLCFAKARVTDDQLFLMIDRDRVPLESDLVERMQTVMNADPKIGLLSAVDPKHCKQADIGFCMIRLDAIRGVTLTNVYAGHLCAELNQRIVKNGFKCEYLANSQNSTMEV
jgi:hypothetical protein